MADMFENDIKEMPNIMNVSDWHRIIMNTLIIAKMTKVTYDDWKIKFDEDAEVQSKMMRNTTVGKVDDNTAMVLTEVFNPEMVQEFMNSDDFKEMETNLGLSHEVYKVEKID